MTEPIVLSPTLGHRKPFLDTVRLIIADSWMTRPLPHGLWLP